MQISNYLIADVTHLLFYTSQLQIIAHSHKILWSAFGTVIFQCDAVAEITQAIKKNKTVGISGFKLTLKS